ncbi:hypothetical protein KDJ56_10930 [Brevibacillus composti]|uniref:Uncharacterized protein n=1 Tax=Brevibacillus composti TaxID=2796470 RepID=A0A7T5EPJ3_9BACL|nr:hypothetical protein [Brevibacillus composti]QQE76390.1 hypothetical protein JD108_11245 [Brevibacillus composti]QUO43417.1 hypothetical protein KDJ56_10930 [Brevibacillus composti]
MLTYHQFAVSELTSEQRQACLRLAEKALHEPNSLDLARYLSSKWEAYPQILMAKSEHGMAAFQLLHAFACNGEHYLYLGPLFSERGAYLRMFLHFYESLQKAYPAETFHLMAELQNPELMIIFKTLFRRASYPALTGEAIPEKARETARIFADRLKHIEQLDLQKLSTCSRHTLYRKKAASPVLLSWLGARGIYPEEGGSQILLHSSPPAPALRKRVKHDLNRGLFMLKHWSRFRDVMLKKFEEGIPR